MEKLRVICDKSQPADFNMAADLYLFNRCKSESDTVFLRLYQWRNPTITIGYMQKKNSLISAANLSQKKLSIIRRTTGGRAVLHWDDITYSVSFPQSMKRMGKDINSTYEVISSALKESLIKLGVFPEYHNSDLDRIRIKSEAKLPCFLSPNKNELMVNGKKLIGSAQKRGESSVLQHGSIPLNGHFRKIIDYLKIDEDKKDEVCKLLESDAISLNECINVSDISAVEECLIEGFSENLNLPGDIKNWSVEELESIKELKNSSAFKKKWLVNI